MQQTTSGATTPGAGNSFKAALARGERRIGLWLSMADAVAAEIVATAGFHWLLLDGEHAPNDIRTTLSALQALQAYASHPVVRVVTGEAHHIKQVLDIGAQTILVPMVESGEQARALVAATRYPPEGIRGVGAYGARVTRWGLRRDYLAVANDEVCLLVQAETPTALGNLEAICAVDGVDGVFIGPADLSSSMGHRGNPGHPEVQAAIEKAIRTIVAHGKAAGILTPDTALAQRYLSIGATFVAVGLDVMLLGQSARKLAAEFGAGPA